MIARRLVSNILLGIAIGIVAGFVFGTALAIVVALSVNSARGRDFGQYGNVAPDVRACFKALKDKSGASCCDTADGTRLEDPDWRADVGGGHSVYLEGAWRKVPPSADSSGTTQSCVAYAIVWRMNGRIICFLPGSEN